MKSKYYSCFIDVLKTFEKNSTCVCKQNACLVIKDDRIISTGWTGSTKGMPHCDEKFVVKESQFDIDHHIHTTKYYYKGISGVDDKEISKEEFCKEHEEFERMNEVHAEENAIGFAVKMGVSLDGCDMLITRTPCEGCAKLMVTSGIKKVML